MVGERESHRIRFDVAVVIATLERDDDLAATLRQLADQTVLPGQCVVIDQGTPAKKDGMLEPLRRVGVRARYLFSKYKSISAARNLGLAEIREATTVIYIDDDVAIGPDLIEKHLSYYDNEPKTVAVAGHVACAPLGEEFERLNTFRPTGEYVTQGRGCHMSFRTAVLREIGGFNAYIANSGDETELYRRLRKAGYQVRNGARVSLLHLVTGKGGNREVGVWSRGHYARGIRDGIVRAAKDRGLWMSLLWPMKNREMIAGLFQTAGRGVAGGRAVARELARGYRLAWYSCRRRDYILLSVDFSAGIGVDSKTGLPTV